MTAIVEATLPPLRVRYMQLGVAAGLQSDGHPIQATVQDLDGGIPVSSLHAERLDSAMIADAEAIEQGACGNIHSLLIWCPI